MAASPQRSSDGDAILADGINEGNPTHKCLTFCCRFFSCDMDGWIRLCKGMFTWSSGAKCSLFALVLKRLDIMQ